MRITTIIALALAAVSLACSSGQTTPEQDAALEDAALADGGAWELVIPDLTDAKVKDKVIFPDLPKDNAPPQELNFELADAPKIDLAPNCESYPLEFGCECAANDDCSGGWCVQGPESKICTSSCLEECPVGYTCELLAGTCPDCQQVCLPMWVNLCRPCASHSDCQQPGFSQGNLCLDQGAQGSFCGYECTTNHECPVGFLCKDVDSGEGTAKQCVKSEGQCSCSGLFIAAGASTDCFVQNEYGTCDGQRGCIAAGLTDCDAASPAPETCDGLDNDCDGGVDEELNICGEGGKVCKCEADDCACVCPEPLVDCGQGECIDLQTNVAHCGECNDPCLADNVDTFVCQGGQCKIVNCSGGWENFNGKVDDGCECEIMAEVCDGADNDCDGAIDEGEEICPGMEGCEGTCDDGICTCPPGCDYCDGMCVTYLSYFDDPKNCGYCGNTCALENTVLHYCEGGNCCPQACEEGWADCDGICNNGCEWEIKQELCNCIDDDCDTDIDEQPLADCAPPKQCVNCFCQCPTDDPLIMDCGDAGCVNIGTAPDHCGWCDNSCTQMEWPNVKTYGCQDMACTILMCQPNFFDTNEQPWDGCECEKTSQAELCDFIDNDCDGEIDEAPFTDCAPPKVCEFGFCSCPLDQPQLQECVPNQCIDILAHPKHCGFCDNDCKDMGLPNVMNYGCDGGLCSIAMCQMPWQDENGQLFDGCECEKTSQIEVCDLLDNNCDGQIDEVPNNCIPPKLCLAGDCVCPPEQPNLQDCGTGLCTDTYTDPKNCGFCGNECTLENVAFQKCEEGLCAVPGCKPGFKDCNNIPSDGCEFTINIEECNGFDDDCDLEIDEGAQGIGQPCDSGLPGLCSNGIQSCEDGALKCNPNIQPGQYQEVCDGKDNNCDGQVDENNPGGGGPCTVGGLSGECKFGVLECLNGSASCQQTVFPQPEACDNKDNDCDGIVDGMEQDCWTSCGEGKEKCNGGQWGTCSAMEPKTCMNYDICQEEIICELQCPPKPQESCNGIDDDCDYEVDETYACSPGQEKSQNCGNCGTQVSKCSNNCQWGSWSPCSGQGECAVGQTKQEGSCGNCGKQQYSCSGSCFWDYQGCQGEGTCSPGQKETETCGLCGTRTRTCSGNCTWGGWSSCSGQGVCSSGQQQSQGCGDCGTQYKTCNGSCQWGSWGSCQSQGVCSPGEQDTDNCGNCGSKKRSCTGSCNWGSWGSCTGQGSCSAGSTQTESCGNCGTRKKTCSSSCNWGSWGSCTGQGPCVPGQEAWCSGCERKECKSNCQWGSCNSWCGNGATGDGCYCDSNCINYGDCCTDAADECNIPTCIGQCGGSAAYDSAVGDTCWCDSYCANSGDCCKDARDICGVQTCREHCGEEFSGCDCDWNCWLTSCCSDKDDWCG